MPDDELEGGVPEPLAPPVEDEPEPDELPAVCAINVPTVLKERTRAATVAEERI